MAGIEKIKSAVGSSGPSADSLNRIREMADGGKTGRSAVKKGMAQSPNTRKQGADAALSLGIARELLPYAEGRQQLQSMFRELSPEAQKNFLTAIAHQTRDPRSPSDGFSLSQEGQAIHDIVLNDSLSDGTVDFIRQAGTRVRDSGDPVREGTNLNEISAEEDFSEKSAPDRPKTGDRQFPKPSDSPSFRSTETTKLKDDGTFQVKHSDQHYDRQTKAAVTKGEEYEASMAARDAAIRKALLKQYGSQEAINAADTDEIADFISFLDLPEVAPRPAAIPDQNSSGRGGALAASMKPEENYTKAMHRLAETRDPHTAISHGGSVIEGEEAAGVPSSVFAPGGTRGVQGPAIATVRPQDHADLMMFARRLGLKSPNELGSAEEFARALVSGGHQEGFNITPVTPSQRADATDLVGDLADDASGITPTAAGRTLRTYMPEEAKAASAAQRALLQEQAIQTIARKAEAVFGHQGWGENYKPSTRPGGTDGPSTEGPSLAGTTQDAGNVPAIGDQPNRRGEPDAPPPALRDYSKPGTDVDPELTAGDLDYDYVQRNNLDPDAAPVGGEADSVVRKGYAEGDKKTVGPSKAREEGGNKPGEYADDQNFAQFNAENPGTTPDELARRQQVYDNMKPRMQAEHDSSRSSTLRRQIREAIDANPQPGPEVVSHISKLQKQLRAAERLDMQSGVKSSMSDDFLDAAEGIRMGHHTDDDTDALIDSVRGWQERVPQAYADSEDRINALVQALENAKGKHPEAYQALREELSSLGRHVGRPDAPEIRPKESPEDPGTGMALRPEDNPADLDGGKLAAAETEIGTPNNRRGRMWYQDKDGNWVEGEPYELDDKPLRDVTASDGGTPPPPDEPKRPTAPEPEQPKKGWSRYSKAALGGALVGGGFLGYDILQRGGQPGSAEFTPQPSPDGGGIPITAEGNIGRATSESRIRAISKFLKSGKINADTQTLQNWTN